MPRVLPTTLNAKSTKFPPPFCHPVACQRCAKLRQRTALTNQRSKPLELLEVWQASGDMFLVTKCLWEGWRASRKPVTWRGFGASAHIRAATLTVTDGRILPFSFLAVARKRLTAAFDGGRLTSDGGVMLRALADRRVGVPELAEAA